MSPFKPFDPERLDFPDTGNRIGFFDGDVPVRLPDRDRAFRPLLVTGAGEAMERWIAGQMVQDATRGENTLVCIDPGGHYADAFARRLDKSDARRVVWIDLDAAFETGRRGAGRVFPINPCDPAGRNDPGHFAAFRNFLISRLAPLTSESREALEFTLDAFHRAFTREADRAFTLTAVSLFLQDRDYRRYILSGLHPALLGLGPGADAFERAAREIGAKLRPIFAEPVWRATLGVATAPQLAKLPPAPIIIVTGAALAEDSLPADLWRFAFLSHLAVRTSKRDAGARIYGFGAGMLDSLALDALLTGKPGRNTLLTLARDAYGQTDHRPRLLFDQEIAFDPDASRLMGHIHARTGDDCLFVQPKNRGGSFTLTIPPEAQDRARHPALPGICRKSSAYRYGRALLYPIMDIDALVRACGRGDRFYDTLDIPAPLAWRAEMERECAAFPKKAVIRPRPENPDNPFLRPVEPVVRRNPFRPDADADAA